MQQYKAYLEETYQGQSCHIDPQSRGWASYKISGQECYIDHCYVAPEFRATSAIYEINQAIEQIAKDASCTHMTGTVDLASSAPMRSVKMMEKAGYKLHSAQNNIIVMIKLLGKE
jgi:hypothetical protein